MALEGFVPVGDILHAGIYALIWRGRVVYIGKSKQMLGRINAHWARGKGPRPDWLPKTILFDDVHVLPCKLEDIDALEAGMIEIYRPRYNVQLKKPQLGGLVINGRTITIPGPKPPPAPEPFVRRF